MPETTQFAGMDGTTGGYNSLQVGTVLLARYKILGVLGGHGYQLLLKVLLRLLTEYLAVRRQLTVLVMVWCEVM